MTHRSVLSLVAVMALSTGPAIAAGSRQKANAAGGVVRQKTPSGYLYVIRKPRGGYGGHPWLLGGKGRLNNNGPL
jgi:hypothetical protein